MDEKKKKLAGLGAVSLIGIASAVGIFSVVSNKVANSNNDKVAVETLAGKEATNPNRQNEGEAFNVGELDVDVEAPSYEDLPKETITETDANGETVQNEYGVLQENSDGSKLLVSENGEKLQQNSSEMQTIAEMHIERVTEAERTADKETETISGSEAQANGYKEVEVKHGSEGDTQNIKYNIPIYETDEAGYSDGIDHTSKSIGDLSEQEYQIIENLEDIWVDTDVTETQFKEYFEISCKSWMSQEDMNKIRSTITAKQKSSDLYSYMDLMQGK